MGVKIFDLIEAQQIQLKELHGKTIAIDGNLVLYQFLSSIRQRDGSFLTDSHGNVTSHLSGLFSRCTRLMQYGIRLCFVFDGKSPELKQQEQKRRRHLKEEAIVKYKEARLHEDIAEMRKYAARTSSLTKEMITEAREMLAALGVPVIQAPSEGEAQAAQIVKNGDASEILLYPQKESSLARWRIMRLLRRSYTRISFLTH
jgi:flap endonuclease-1